MNIVVLRETQPGEARVALMPESIKKLVALKAEVLVESGAGLRAARSDEDYLEAGAVVSGDRQELLKSADILPAENRPSGKDMEPLKSGESISGFWHPPDEPAALLPALERG